MKVGRPCDPDDVVNSMRRLELPPVHCRTVVAWGKKRIEPHDGTDARRLWDEAMARLDAVLREKGIVKTRHRASELGIVDRSGDALKWLPAMRSRSGAGRLPETTHRKAGAPRKRAAAPGHSPLMVAAE